MSWILIIVIVGGIFWFVKEYNSLQAEAQRIKAGDSNIKTAMHRKVDTINQLIPIVEGYGNHEKIIHIKVSDNLKEMACQSAHVVQNIQALASNFPELKANQTYQNLMDQIVNLEAQLQGYRVQYNQNVEFYNSHLKGLPICLVAGPLGFKEAPYYDFDNDEAIKSFQGADEQILVDMLKTSGTKIKDTSMKLKDTMEQEVAIPLKKQLEKKAEKATEEKDENPNK